MDISETPIRPLDCGPGKVFVLEVPADYQPLTDEEADRIGALFTYKTGSKLIILPPGYRLCRGTAEDAEKAKQSWRDSQPLL